jgi:hypothetical protein
VSSLTRAKKIGTEAQASLPPDTLPKLDGKGIKHVQQMIGSILCYAWAVNMTMFCGTNERNRKNNGKMHTIIGLPLAQRGRKSLLHCIQHDIKHTLQRILLVGSKGLEPRMWNFFHGMDAKKMENPFV